MVTRRMTSMSSSTPIFSRNSVTGFLSSPKRLRTSDNKLIYQCGKKLDLLKTYIALAKETIVMQEKQQKIDSAAGSGDDKDEVIVSLERT